MLKDTDYITYDYLHTRIVLCSRHGSQSAAALSLEAFFNDLFMRCGSSLAAARKACRLLSGQHKYTPLCLFPPGSAQPLCFLPTARRSSASLCYINFFRIASLKEHPEKKSCIITFTDGLCLEAGKAKQMQQNYLKAEQYLARLYSSQSSQ